MMDGGVIVTDFANRVWQGISYFAGGGSDVKLLDAPSKEDAADLKEFTRPLVGKTGARLGIKQARTKRPMVKGKPLLNTNLMKPN